MKTLEIKFIPPLIWKKIKSFREYEAANILAKLVGNRKSILNVGCFWGRDSYYLLSKNKRVTSIDLVKQDVPNLIVGDVTQTKLNFKEKFDVIICAEVLEHLFEDAKFLDAVREYLKENGRLIVTIPYYNDLPEYHARIHSKRTIIRLLKNSGFFVEEYIERGALINLSKPINLFSKVLAKIDEKLQLKFLDLFVRVDIFLGKRGLVIKKKNSGYGAYMSAKKINKRNYIQEINFEEFSRK